MNLKQHRVKIHKTKTPGGERRSSWKYHKERVLSVLFPSLTEKIGKNVDVDTLNNIIKGNTNYVYLEV